MYYVIQIVMRYIKFKTIHVHALEKLKYCHRHKWLAARWRGGSGRQRRPEKSALLKGAKLTASSCYAWQP